MKNIGHKLKITHLYLIFSIFFLMHSEGLLSIPIVNSISPISGLNTGGQSVTISGANFTGVTAVHFGSLSAPFSFINDTTIQVTTPASIPIVVDVTVTTGSGTSAINQNDRFVFQGDWLTFIPNFNSNTVNTTNDSTLLINPNPIPVGANPNDVCITANGSTAYCINSGSNDITPIDVLTLTPLANISTGPSTAFPILMALVKDPITQDNIGYTANFLSGNVSQINLTTDLVTNIIPVGANPAGGAAVLDFSTNPPTPIAIYVVNTGSSNITRIDLSDPLNPTTSTINTGLNSIPSFISITPDQTTAYFTDDNPNANAFRQINNVNTVTPSLGISLTDPAFNFNGFNLFPQISIAPDGTKAYVTNTGSNTITTIDNLNTGPTVGCSIIVESDPNGMIITPDGKRLYVCNAISNAVSLVNNLPTCFPNVINLAVGNTPTDPNVTPDQAPAAFFIASPTIGNINQTITFDASASASPVGSISTYIWDFGDGTLPITTTNSAITHSYTTQNIYSVLLTVINSAGTSVYSSSVYNGQTMVRNGGPSAQYTLPIVIMPTTMIPTKTILTTDLNPSNLSDPVTFTATVTSPTLTPVTSGTIQFIIDGGDFGSPITVPLDGSGIVAVTISTLTGGEHTVLAQYTGNATFNNSLSNPINQFVNPDPTTSSVTSNINPSTFGQLVTFIATVTANDPDASGHPEGTVQFIYNNHVDFPTIFGTATLDPVTGQASFSYAGLDVDNYDITVNFIPSPSDPNHLGSTSPIYIQHVIPVDTTTTITSDANPSTYGQTVDFTIMVQPVSGGGTPTGYVELFNGTASLGIAILGNGEGFFTLDGSELMAGTNSIQAVYHPDNVDFNPSTGFFSQLVSKVVPNILVSDNPNPSVFGQSVTLTATVSPVGTGVTPTGSVTFTSSDGTVLGSSPLVNGVATFMTSNLEVGTPTITAAYGGDTNYNATTGETTQTVMQTPTTTTIVSSRNPSNLNDVVNFTATVLANAPGAGIPSGFVQFIIDGVLVDTRTLSPNGQAFFSQAFGTTGPHTVVANYLGDTDFLISSDSIIQSVQGMTTTVVTANPVSPSVFGQNVNFTATVSSEEDFPTPITGSVQFFVDGQAYGLPVTLDGNGKATLPTSSLPIGTHTITSTYSGDTHHLGSNSAPITYTVNPAPTITILTSSLNPSSFGQTVTFTAIVTANSPSSAIPNGTVIFSIDGGPGIAVTLVNGQASLPTASLSVGNHMILATYLGNSNFISSSSFLTQIVNQDATVTVVTSSVNPASIGQTVTFTASVSGIVDSGIPTGTVTFIVDGVPGIPVTLVNGQASFQTATLSIGKHTIVAIYSGDVNHLFSTSAPFVETIIPILPPRDIAVHQVENRFATQTDIVNVLTWKAPHNSAHPVLYKIYRDCELTELVAIVNSHDCSSSSHKKFKYEDHNRKKGHTYHYFIISINEFAISSSPVEVIFHGGKYK